MAEIRRIVEGGAGVIEQLAGLLADAVAGGSSLGFLATSPPGDLHAFWSAVLDDVRGGRIVLLVAEDGGEIVGTVHLQLAGKANARHRAEVAKLIVHRRWRGRGLGRRLMLAVEQAARSADRTLLVLDTQTGSPAERLYLALGYREVGTIVRYAASPDGTLHGTTIMSRELQAEEDTTP